MPSSFWNRMDSIMNADEDPTGSRAARVRLLNQGLEVFADNPITGIGAGQFQNYNGPGFTEKWRVTHNVWLQVACELGMFGFSLFLFLVVRAYSANFRTLRILRLPRKRKTQSTPADAVDLTADERVIIDTNAKGMIAAMVGWTVCSFFASVAFNWTLYYVLALSVAGREVAASRRTETVGERVPQAVPAPRLVRANA
jgi:O-antigen ligase